MTFPVFIRPRALFPVFLVSCAALALVGCATSEKTPLKDKGEAKAVVFREFTLKDLRDDLAGRQKLVRTMSGNVSVEYANRIVPGGKQSMTGTFGFEMPDKIHMSLGKPLTSFQVDLISDGDRYWLVNHARKSVQTGKCENIVGVDNDKVLLRPMDIVDAYFLREITDQPGFPRRITFLETIGNYYIISVLRPDFNNFLYSKIWVDRFTANVVRHQLYDSEKGTVRVDAMLGDYKNVGDASLPHRLTVSWPSQLSALDIQFKGMRLNPKWENPKVFVFDSTKPDYVFADLDQSAKMEQQGTGLREQRPGAVPGYPPQPGSAPGSLGSPFAPVPDRRKTPSGSRVTPPGPAPPEPAPDYVPPPNPYGVKKAKPKVEE